MMLSSLLLTLSLLRVGKPPHGPPIPGDVACNAKLLAYEFAVSLQPERDARGLAVIALGLGVDPATKTCTGPSPSPGPPPGPPPPPRPPVPAGECSAIMPGVNLVYGNKKKGWPTTDTAEDCEAMCKSNTTCTKGTWHSPSVPHYGKACILESDGQYVPHRQDDHFSFICNTTGTVGRVPDPEPYGVWWAPEDRRLDQQAPRSKGWRASVPPLEPSASLYVDAAKGSDSAAGSIDAPLKTIQAAVDKASASASETSIYLRAGTFYLPASVVIKASGITIAPYQNEDVTVSGGVQLTPTWSKTASVAYNVVGGPPSPPAAYDTYVAAVPAGLNFMELFNASNARLVPARNPNGNPEADQNNYKLSGKETSCKDFGPVDAVIVNNTCDGCTDKSKGYFGSYSMGVGGPANNFVPAISYWAQPHPHGGGANTYDIPNGVETSTPMQLSPGGGGYVFMMQTHHWGSWVYEIADVGGNGSSIQFGAGGFQEARGGSGGCGTGAFYLSHRKEFLDFPGEWWLDTNANKLYTVVEEGAAPPTTVTASVVPYLFKVDGTQHAPVKNIRISSLTLRHAAPTYMANYSVGSGGDYSVHRGGAISLVGTENVTVDHNLFDGVGGNGVWLHAYNRHALVTANEMRNIGENGVGFTGETVWVDGTGGNQPRFNTVSGNLIHHLGLYTKQACAVFSAVSCQNLVEENVFFHGPRALFNMNDDFGGDTVIKSNLFFKSLLETSDHGPYNSWDRLPYLTTVLNGSKTIDSSYNHLTANMFFSGSPFAIDTDDGSDRVNATNNVIVAQPLFKTDFAGHSKTFQGNVDLYSSCGASSATGDPTNVFSTNKCVGSGSPAGCSPCATPGKDCAVIQGNEYFTLPANSSSKVLCPAGDVEAGSTQHAIPADGGIALSRAALGMA